MRQFIWIAVCLVVVVGLTEGRVIVKRQAELDPTNQEVESSEEKVRDKRHQDLKFGVKNALLGFVFNKINSFIDSKTAWVDQLDRTNIAKNKLHGIEPPKDPVSSLSETISGVIGQKLQAAGPLIGVAVQTLTSGSGGLSSGSGGFNIGSLLGGLSGGGAGGGGASIGAEVHADVGAGGYGGKK